MTISVNTPGPSRHWGDPWRFVGAMALLAGFLAPVRGQENSEASPWSGSVSVRAMSRLAQYGLDTAPERVTFVAGGTAAHGAGYSITAGLAAQPGPWTIQRFSAAGEVETALGDPWSAGFSLTHTWYPAGSTSPLAASPTSASASVSYDGDIWSFGAEVDRYFGGDGATYASIDASVFLPRDGFSVLPMVSLSFGSQTVAATSLKRVKGNRPTTVTAVETITGLSSIDVMALLLFPLGDDWSASLIPGLIYTPSELAASSTRFTWSVGIRHSL